MARNQANLKKWRKANYQKNREILLQRVKDYNDQHKSEKQMYDRLYRINNKDKIKKYATQ